jgi:hypothetical protein
MRKFNFAIIIIAMLMLIMGTGNAQYKLSIGNFWVYTGDNQEWKISIIDTAILFDSLKYYETYEQKEWRPKLNPTVRSNVDTNQYFIRKRNDDLFEEVIIYNAIEDTVIKPYFYKNNAQLGEKWIYRISDNDAPYDTVWAEVVNVFEGYQFGELKTIKEITYWTGLSDFSKFFCDDFGELSEVNYLGVTSLLKGCYVDGVAYGDTSFVVVSVTDDSFPNEFNLTQNYPNPFNPNTVINYSLPKRSHVKLYVYDIKGEEVAILLDEIRSAGNFSVNFNASKFSLASGIYFYSFISDNFNQTKKMIYLR